MNLPRLRWAILADSPTAIIHLQSCLHFLQATRNLDGAQTVRPCGIASSYTTNTVTSIHMTSSKSSNIPVRCTKVKVSRRDCSHHVFVSSRCEMINRLSVLHSFGPSYSRQIIVHCLALRCFTAEPRHGNMEAQRCSSQQCVAAAVIIVIAADSFYLRCCRRCYSPF